MTVYSHFDLVHLVQTNWKLIRNFLWQICQRKFCPTLDCFKCIKSCRRNPNASQFSFPRWSLGEFFPSSSELEELTQTYILKPLQRRAWMTLNEKQSYLFTTTLIGPKVLLSNFFFNSQLGNEKVNWREVCRHKSKLYFQSTN